MKPGSSGRWLEGLAGLGVAAVFLGWGLVSGVADEFQQRQALNLTAYDGERLDLLTYAEVRYRNREPGFAGFHLSERVRWEWYPFLHSALGYSYLDVTASDAPEGAERHSQHRAELELNPVWRGAEDFELRFRNRIELRWLEGISVVDPRTRSRVEAFWRVKGLKPVNALFSQYEFIYDWRLESHSEDRIVPAGVEWRLGAKASLRVWYEWQRYWRPREWAEGHLLYTSVQWKP